MNETMSSGGEDSFKGGGVAVGRWYRATVVSEGFKRVRVCLRKGVRELKGWERE